jgi:long-chain acyl-CoA synthetase
MAAARHVELFFAGVLHLHRTPRRQGERATPDELLAFLRDRLASYKVPKAIEFRTELPLAFTGKVLRRVLAEQEPRETRSALEALAPGRMAPPGVAAGVG